MSALTLAGFLLYVQRGENCRRFHYRTQKVMRCFINCKQYTVYKKALLARWRHIGWDEIICAGVRECSVSSFCSFKVIIQPYGLPFVRKAYQDILKFHAIQGFTCTPLSRPPPFYCLSRSLLMISMQFLSTQPVGIVHQQNFSHYTVN